MRLPKMWFGPALVGKFGAPAILFWGAGLVMSWPSVDFEMVIYRLLMILPLVLAGLFFLFVPVQLRGDGQTVAYRRWLDWAELPPCEIRSLCMFNLGEVAIIGTKKKLVFFLEPENRPLLDKRLKSSRAAPLCTSEVEAPSPLGTASRTILDVVATSLGVLAEIFAPTIQSGRPGPPWLTPLWNVEDHYFPAIAALGVVAILMHIRAKRPRGVERTIYLLFVGVLAGCVLTRLWVIKI